MKAQITLPQNVLDFIAEFKKSGYECFAVGGCIRELLLKKPVLNWDFATNAPPESMTRLFVHSFYNNSYGTVTIKWPQEATSHELFEVTPYRVEGIYKDNRHPDTVVWAKTIEEDLTRRDFTINAMAYDGTKFIDAFDGLDDLKNGIIKAVGEPEKRFKEDALRMLRAVRFASTLGFLIEPQTAKSIRDNSGQIAHISHERITAEFLKIMGSPYPGDGVLLLKNLKLLKIILPELDICFEIPQKSPKRHHIYDVGTHMVMSLKNCKSGNPITRFATLIHDIGKAPTFSKDPKTELITFYNHEVVGAQMTQKIADRFKLSAAQKDLLIRLVANHQFVVSEELTDNAIRRFIRNVGRENLEEMFALRHGDRMGGAAAETSWRTELFKKRVAELLIEPFTVKDLKINGQDVMQILNIKPSPKVGDVLDDLFEKVINKELENERDTLLAAIKNQNHNT